MSRNSWNGKSGDGIGTGTESETEVEMLGIFLDCFGFSVGWISSPYSEIRIALLGSGIFLRMFMLPICCCIGGGLYSFGNPFSLKKLTGTAAA